MAESISGLAVANGARQRGDVGRRDQVAVDVGVSDFQIRPLRVMQRV